MIECTSKFKEYVVIFLMLFFESGANFIEGSYPPIIFSPNAI